MRRLFLGVTALTFAALIGTTAEGQIRLVPGPQKLVSFAPRFITAAFFNADGFEDAAVTNSASNQVTVLFGADGSSFGSAISFNIGRTLRGIQSGDINSDGKADISVADYIDGKVFTATGNGDGTFNPPVFYKAGAYAFDVAVGNFDGQKGNDLMVVDQGINKVSVFLNKGGNEGFDSNSRNDYSVGSRPKRGASADLNGDGLDDIIAINTGTAAADSVSILLNNGVGGFLTPATNFTVGAGAVDLAIADYNDDGVLDIAVLNQNIVGAQTTRTVSILINETQLVNGKRVGTGFFTSGSPLSLNCPASIQGVPITCRPNGIAAGDFDNDGFIDLAVTFFTQPQQNAGSVATSGLVQAFQGHGNGTFDFATQVTVGIDPEGIVAGDFNGDGIADMTIAEQGSRSVRIINSLPPPPLENGAGCHLGRQCASNFCVDGVCCSTASCPATCPSNTTCPPAVPLEQFCNIPDTGGICSFPVPDGSRCTLPNQCVSDFCVDGFCCDVRICPSGEFCNTGSCAPPADNGTPCNDANTFTGGDDQCNSGHCTDGVCCSDDRCPAGQSCNIPTFEGTCMAKLPVGSSCIVDGQCVPPTADDTSGFCTDGVCCGVRVCPNGQSCNIPPHEGACALLPTPLPTATPTATPQSNGSACNSGGQCISTFCVDDVCCSAASCPTGQTCNVSGFRGHCHTKLDNGSICVGDEECLSLNCQVGSPSTCQAARTPTPTPTFGPGHSCGATSECSPLTCNTDEGVCCNKVTCPAGQSCTVSTNPGFCTQIPPTATPTPTLPALGHACDSADQCDSGNCTNGVCCDTDICGAGELCNICGSKGICTLPGNVGDSCDKNTDCDALLECLHNGLPGGSFCTGCNCTCGVPGPTPTFPAPTPTDGPGAQTTTFRSGGGCSINNGTDGGAFWLLAALPLLFGMRRIRLQGARISRARARR